MSYIQSGCSQGLLFKRSHLMDVAYTGLFLLRHFRLFHRADWNISDSSHSFRMMPLARLSFPRRLTHMHIHHERLPTATQNTTISVGKLAGVRDKVMDIHKKKVTPELQSFPNTLIMLSKILQYFSKEAFWLSFFVQKARFDVCLSRHILGVAWYKFRWTWFQRRSNMCRHVIILRWIDVVGSHIRWCVTPLSGRWHVVWIAFLGVRQAIWRRAIDIKINPAMPNC